jgi:hypothetical protein
MIIAKKKKAAKYPKRAKAVLKKKAYMPRKVIAKVEEDHNNNKETIHYAWVWLEPYYEVRYWLKEHLYNQHVVISEGRYTLNGVADKIDKEGLYDRVINTRGFIDAPNEVWEAYNRMQV